MFDKSKKNIANERVLYEAQPNFFLSCKNMFIAVICLGVLSSFYSVAANFIGNMQINLISSVNLPLSKYFAIAMFVLMIFVFIYIIWQFLIWNSTKYTITDYRIITKKGIINENKSYMSYNTIQDINVSQSIIAKIFSVGTLSLYSAFDGKSLELVNISESSKVEEIVFENMNKFRAQNQFNSYPNDGRGDNYSSYLNDGRNTYSSFSGEANSNLYDEESNHSAYNLYDDLNEEKVNNRTQQSHYNSMDDLNDLKLVNAKKRKNDLRKSKYNKNYSHKKSKPYNSRKNNYGNNANRSNLNSNVDYGNNANRSNLNINNGSPYSDRSNDFYYDSRNPQESYDNSSDGTIRDSYVNNPEKYFGENYDKLHKDHLNKNIDDIDNQNFNQNNYFDEYGRNNSISDKEFDNTVDQAMQNLDKGIKFKHNPNKQYNGLNYEGHSFIDSLDEADLNINDKYPESAEFLDSDEYSKPSAYEGHVDDYYSSKPSAYEGHVDDYYSELDNYSNDKSYSESSSEAANYSNSQNRYHSPVKNYDNSERVVYGSFEEDNYYDEPNSSSKKENEFFNHLNDKNSYKDDSIGKDSSKKEKSIEDVFKKHSQKFKR